MNLALLLSLLLTGKGSRPPPPPAVCVPTRIERAEPDGGLYAGRIFRSGSELQEDTVCLKNQDILTLEDSDLTVAVTLDGGAVMLAEQAFLSAEGCDAGCVVRVHSEPVRFESAGSGLQFRNLATRMTDAGVRLPIETRVRVQAAPAGVPPDDVVTGFVVVRRPVTHPAPLSQVALVEGSDTFYVVGNTIFIRPGLEGPRANWSFDFDDGLTTSKPAGLELKGTGRFKWGPGRRGSALTIEANQFSVTGDAGAPTDALTVGLWVRWQGEASQPVGKNQVLLGGPPSADPYTRCGIVVVTDGYIHFADNESRRTPLEPNAWHHVAVVSDRGEARLFLDGEPTESQKRRISPLGLRVGACDADRGSGTMKALVDDLSIWRRPLSDEEVRAIVRVKPRD